MKHSLPTDLGNFGINDLRKIALDVLGATAARGIVERDHILEVLADESPSLLAPAMTKVMASGRINERDLDVERALGMGHHEAEACGAVDSKAVEELKTLVQATQQGVARFAENVDARVEKIEEIARRLIDLEPLRIVIEKPADAGAPAGAKPTIVHEGPAHREFPTLLLMAQAKCNILMVGPAGSGKTTAAEMLSKALGVPFHFNGAIDTEYKLKGFVDAQGRIVHTEFRKAFEEGGVYLFDEVDASLPAATMAFNAALANGWCDFPDGRVVRHPNTVIIAAANTFLGGATFEYVGRNKQDAAFADRFVVLAWDVDENMEAALCTNDSWCKHVQRIRGNAKRKGLKVIISPRASFEGAKLIKQGLPWELAEKAAIKKGMTDEQWQSIK